MADGKKYYWLKLQKDFFKRHDIRIIEDMPNGKDYILFYLKLLVESISHEGELRFNETIPYNDNMLATITNTNVDVVRGAMDIFQQLNMIEILENQTIFMTEVNKMLGVASTDEQTRENTRVRVANYRQRQKQIESQNRYSNVTCNVELEKELELELEKELEIELEKDNISNNRKKFTPPSVEDVREYCESRNNGIDAEEFVAFYDSKNWMIGKDKMTNWKSAVITWEKRRKKEQSKSNSRLVPVEEILKI